MSSSLYECAEDAAALHALQIALTALVGQTYAKKAKTSKIHLMVLAQPCQPVTTRKSANRRITLP